MTRKAICNEITRQLDGFRARGLLVTELPIVDVNYQHELRILRERLEKLQEIPQTPEGYFIGGCELSREEFYLQCEIREAEKAQKALSPHAIEIAFLRKDGTRCVFTERGFV